MESGLTAPVAMEGVQPQPIPQVNLAGVVLPPPGDNALQHLPTSSTDGHQDKKAKVGTVRVNKQKMEGQYNSPTTMMTWIKVVLLVPNLSRLPLLVSLIAEVLEPVLPKTVKKHVFEPLLLRAVCHNLVHSCNTWTMSIRYAGKKDDHVPFALPTVLAHVVASFKPINGSNGVTPSLYPSYQHVKASCLALLAAKNLRPFDKDMTGVPLYEVCLQQITKNLQRDIFVTGVDSESLLDAGYLTSDADGDLLFGHRAVSNRALSRREELLAAVLGCREYEGVSLATKVFVPLLEDSEEGALGVLVGYMVSDRVVTQEDFLRELVYPTTVSKRA